MEIVGLTVGTVSLAGLFNTCIEAFSYLKAAQSLERDLQILLVKLDIQKARLLSWGNSVGITQALKEGDNGIWEDEQKRQIIKSTLESIHILLTDSQQLRDRYALCELPQSSNIVAFGRVEPVSSTSMTIFRRSYNRLCNRIVKTNGQVPVPNRIIWAIQDREKFGDLVGHLRDLIDGLVTLLPLVVQNAGNRIIENDIASLGISNLHLFLEACQGEQIYQAWSDIASEAIYASEHGTGDNRVVEEWIEDQRTGVPASPALKSPENLVPSLSSPRKPDVQ